MQHESVERQWCALPGAHKSEAERASSFASPHPLLQLQRTAGNRAVQRLLRRGVVRAKPRSTPSGDTLEQQADREADLEVRGPWKADASPAVRATPASTSTVRGTAVERPAVTRDEEPRKESTDQPVQSGNGFAFSGATAPDGGNGGKKGEGGGQRLDRSTRSFMEARFSHDFSRVVVHAGPSSAELTDNLNAHAVTAGSHIYFERGGYSPDTRQGRSVLAHELAHIVQNERGTAQAHATESSLEAEAGLASERAAAGQSVRVRLASAQPTLKLSRGAKAAIGFGIGLAGGAVLGAIGLGIAQAAGASIGGDLANRVLLGAAGAGAVVGLLAGLFSKEKKQELPPEETETEEEKAQDPETRYQRWLRRGLDKLNNSGCRFPSSRSWRYDDRYWERVDDPNFVAYKPKDITPALAVDRLFQNLPLWDFDCALYPEVATLYAFRHTLGTDEFNTRFAGLVLRQHKTTGIPWELHTVQGEGKEAFDKLWDESPAGTKITWTNRSSAADNTAWKHENGIKRVKGQTPDEDRFDAFPIGSNLSEKEVKRGLAEAASDFPRSGEAAKQTYVDANIYRDQLQLLKTS